MVIGRLIVIFARRFGVRGLKFMDQVLDLIIRPFTVISKCDGNKNRDDVYALQCEGTARKSVCSRNALFFLCIWQSVRDLGAFAAGQRN
jgi:hypothetical protein